MPEKGPCRADEIAVAAWTQHMRWEAGRCATYLNKEAILLRTVSQTFRKYGSVIEIFLLTDLIIASRQIFQFHHCRLQARYEEKGRDKKQRPNPWSTSVIHGRKCFDNNSFGILSKNPVFWYSFIHLKMTGKTHLGLRLISFNGWHDYMQAVSNIWPRTSRSCQTCCHQFWNSSNNSQRVS